jgi:hypothetical protein
MLYHIVCDFGVTELELTPDAFNKLNAKFEAEFFRFFRSTGQNITVSCPLLTRKDDTYELLRLPAKYYCYAELFWMRHNDNVTTAQFQQHVSLMNTFNP